jgi:Ca2+-binding EF-hand superfamily protein
MSRHVVEEAPQEAILEALFGIVFALECGLRLFVFRADFFSIPSWGWNLFDLTLVLLQLGEVVGVAIGAMVAGEEGGGRQLAAVQLLRFMRIMRIVRLLRMLRFMHELRLVLSAVLNCFRPFLWTMLLLLLFIYVFGVFLTQLVLNYRIVHASNANLERYYGHLVLSLLSLFESVSGGVAWENMVNPLIESHWSGGLFFVIFISFSLFALLNVVTGVFVESSLAKTREDKESFINESLSNLFRRLDIDLSGVLQWGEFERLLSEDELCEYLQALNLNMSEARSLFALLDKDGSGGVDVLEFVMGCLQLPKPAKCFDMMLLTRDVRTELEAQKIQMQSIHTLCGKLLQSHKDADTSSTERAQGCMVRHY